MKMQDILEKVHYCIMLFICEAMIQKIQIKVQPLKANWKILKSLITLSITDVTGVGIFLHIAVKSWITAFPISLLGAPCCWAH